MIALERALMIGLVAVLAIDAWRISDFVSSTPYPQRAGVAWGVAAILATGFVAGLACALLIRHRPSSRLGDWIFESFTPAVVGGGIYVVVVEAMPLTPAAKALVLALPLAFVLGLVSVAIRFIFFPVEVPCECADETCFAPIRIRVQEYRLVDEHGRRFIVKPGHQDPAVDQVIQKSEAFFVVDTSAHLHERHD